MEREPKFKVGQFLTHKLDAQLVKLFVVEVVTQNCPGGVQHHCKCRVSGRTGKDKYIHYTDIISFNEIELEEYVPVFDSEFFLHEHIRLMKKLLFKLELKEVK